MREVRKTFKMVIAGMIVYELEHIESSIYQESELIEIKKALNIGGVRKCVSCNNKTYKEGASYCDEHMRVDELS
ncbi:MAG: hypothetical protein IZT56_09595 [Bacteroidetes bacterium]|nr:hypothetical protein [Bacteroidota bacterium]